MVIVVPIQRQINRIYRLAEFNILWEEVNKMQAYCVKCRAKVEMAQAQEITMKNGKPATQGVCPKCGTKVFRIGKAA
jgi:DNA-directed RNA polymerase subunit RPC12/RpoP